MPVSMSEKFANNLFTIAVARAAMIITPIILGVFGWIIAEYYAESRARLEAIEVNDQRQDVELQDHEARLKFAAQQADAFAVQIERRFNDLTGSLKDLTNQVVSINGSIIRLQTTIENRLPPPRTNSQPQ